MLSRRVSVSSEVVKMTKAENIKKFASAVIDLAKQAQTISDAAINLKQMQKEASAAKPAFEFDAAKLEKAASAVLTLFGDRATVTKDGLTRVWNANPNSVVDSLVKVASTAVERKVQDQGIVAVKKTASSHKGEIPASNKRNALHESFNTIFGIGR